MHKLVIDFREKRRSNSESHVISQLTWKSMYLLWPMDLSFDLLLKVFEHISEVMNKYSIARLLQFRRMGKPNCYIRCIKNLGYILQETHFEFQCDKTNCKKLSGEFCKDHEALKI